MSAHRFTFKKDGVAIGAQTTAGTSDEIPNLHGYGQFALQLAVSAAATDVGDILAVWVQHSLDGGANWHDVGRFADVLGNGGPVTRKMAWHDRLVTTAEEAKQDAGISASTVRNGMIGDRLRLKWTVTNAGTEDASFTFAVIGWAK